MLVLVELDDVIPAVLVETGVGLADRMLKPVVGVRLAPAVLNNRGRLKLTKMSKSRRAAPHATHTHTGMFCQFAV